MSLRPLGASALIERYSGLCPYDAITAMCRVRPETFSNRMQIFIQQSSAGTSSDILKIQTDGKLILHTSGFATQSVGTTVLSAATDYHVAFVRSGNNRYVYLDGVLELTLNTAESWTKVGEGWLGHWGEATGAFSLGAVKMWSAALSESEVEAERYGYEAVRTSDLQTVSRLLDTSSLGNEVGGGVGWTLSGSVEEGSPPSFPSAGGGGTANLLKHLILA